MRATAPAEDSFTAKLVSANQHRARNQYLDASTKCIYNDGAICLGRAKKAAQPDRSWARYLQRDAPAVFRGPTFTFQDDRYHYEEPRFVTLGLLNGIPSPSRIRKPPTVSESSLSARRRNVSKRSSSKTSETDWRRIRALADKEIRLTREHPEADVAHIVDGIVRRGLKPVPPKTSISLRVDADVLEWFKAQGPGYQKRMNMVLRAFSESSRRFEILGRG